MNELTPEQTIAHLQQQLHEREQECQQLRLELSLQRAIASQSSDFNADDRAPIQESWHTRYALATAAGQTGVWDWNLVTQEIYLDTSLKQLLGYEAHEIADHMEAWGKYVYPPDRPLVQHRVEQHLAGVTPLFEVEHRMCHRDGSLRWFLARGAAIYDQAGQPVRVLGTDTDITLQKQAQAQLQASEAKFRALFEQAGVGIAQVDPAGYLVATNQKFSDLVGYTVPELQTLTVAALTHPDDRHRSQAAIRQLYTESQMTVSLEKRLIHRDQTVVWVNVTVSAICDQAGQVIATMGIVEDIRDRKQVEAELWRSRTMLQAIIDNIPQRIFWKDRHLVYVGCNQAQAELLGFATTDEIVGLMDDDLPITPEQCANYQQQDALCLARDAPQTWVHQQILPNGQVQWTSCHKVLIRDVAGDVDLILGTATDITEQKQVEILLREQAQRERAINQVVTAIRQSLDLEEIFQTTVRTVVELMQLDRAQVVVYEPTHQRWVVVADYTRDPMAPDHTGLVIPDRDNQIAARLKQERAVCLNNVEQRVDRVNQPIAAIFPGAWLLVPLCLASAEAWDCRHPSTAPAPGEGVWGSLTLMRHTPTQDWQPSDIDTAFSIAAHLAIAIQQSQLYQQVHRLNSTLESQVKERTQALQRALNVEALLHRLTQQLSESLDQRELLTTALHELSRNLRVQVGNVAVYQSGDCRTDRLLEVIAVHNDLAVDIQGALLPPTEFPAIYEQLQTVPYCQVTLPIAQLNCTMTVLICPILDEAQVLLGDILLLRSRQDYFTAEEVMLVQQVAHQGAIALRQARLYEAAQAQVHELERLNHLKDDFLSTVSHELRTPMASIQMAAQMLEVLLPLSPEAEVPPVSRPDQVGLAAEQRPTTSLIISADDQMRLTSYLNILKTECQREITLINDLLDLSRLEAETEPLQLVPIQPSLWLMHVAEPFIVRAQQQNQRLTLCRSEASPFAVDALTVVTDLAYLERAVSELLTNACKYTPPHHDIHLILLEASDRWQIQVHNTGSEISPAECERIFDKFYRVPNGDPWKHGGTGLGLALVQRIVKTLQGQIVVTSDSTGVTFTLDFPKHIETS